VRSFVALNSLFGAHNTLSPYIIWFPGTHGTVTWPGTSGAHASPADLLSQVNFGIMGAAEARHNRFPLNGGVMWIRLPDSRALPSPLFTPPFSEFSRAHRLSS
jgi:hypothetical protein